MAPLREDLLKSLLVESGIRVPRGVVCTPLDLDEGALSNLGFPLVVKALVPVGKKGKSGGIRVCADLKTAAAGVNDIVGSVVRGFPCSNALVEEGVDIRQELFLSFMFDGQSGGPVALMSVDGGIDIEEVVHEDSSRMVSLAIDVINGLPETDVKSAWEGLGLPKHSTAAVVRATLQLWKFFEKYDAQTLEINPLALDGDGEVVAVGVLADIDDEALYRQPELAGLVEYGAGRFGRPLTALEQELVAMNEKPGAGTVRYMELDGDILNLVSGGGCSLVTTDQLFDAGLRPATYYDVTGASDELMNAVFRGALTTRGVRGLVFGFNFASIAAVDGRMRILADVLNDLSIDTRSFPIVVRLAGSGQEAAREIASDFPGLKFFGDEVTIEEAVDIFVRRILEMPTVVSS